MRNNTQNYIIVISYISFNLFSIRYDLSKWEYGVAYNYSKLFVAGVYDIELNLSTDDLYIYSMSSEIREIRECDAQHL